MAESGPRTIGEVLGVLKREFPELTVSKIRFLEGQGLMRPGRSPSGYREYWDDDVERLRYILRQQRDHFLPLRVIKDKLQGWERGDVPPTPPPEGPPPDTYFAANDVIMNIHELCQTSGLDRHQAAELLKLGILQPDLNDEDEPVFTEEDVLAARACRDLLDAGLEARHVKTFVLAVDREFDLLTQLTNPFLRHRNPDARRRAAELLASCANAGRELSESLLRGKLRKLLDS